MDNRNRLNMKGFKSATECLHCVADFAGLQSLVGFPEVF